MKRIFTLIAVISVFLGAMAQRPLVTLSHDGNLTFFSNLSALEDAIEAAEDDDILYLSEGTFVSTTSPLTIYKRISFVGCGYNSHILPDLIIKLSTHYTMEIIDFTFFDGVRLEALTFSSENYDINATISNSWIRELSVGGVAGINNLYSRCLIENAEFEGANVNDTLLENCKINNIGSSSDNASIQVINCNIGDTYYCPRVVSSSIIAGSSSGIQGLNPIGTHMIINSWLPSDLLKPGITTNDCYFDVPENGDWLDDNLEATVDLKEKGFLGLDGTVVGVYGGVFPYSVYPTVPTIDSANSSVEYDAGNNKLNVTITVSPK